MQVKIIKHKVNLILRTIIIVNSNGIEWYFVYTLGRLHTYLNHVLMLILYYCDKIYIVLCIYNNHCYELWPKLLATYKHITTLDRLFMLIYYHYDYYVKCVINSMIDQQVLNYMSNVIILIPVLRIKYSKFVNERFNVNDNYTPIFAHGPPLDTIPTLLYKPIGTVDGSVKSGSNILLKKS